MASSIRRVQSLRLLLALGCALAFSSHVDRPAILAELDEAAAGAQRILAELDVERPPPVASGPRYLMPELRPADQAPEWNEATADPLCRRFGVNRPDERPDEPGSPYRPADRGAVFRFDGTPSEMTAPQLHRCLRLPHIASHEAGMMHKAGDLPPPRDSG